MAGVTFSAGRADTSVWGVLTTPNANLFSAGNSDSAAGISDLYLMASLKWQTRSHDAMTYVMGSAPVGTYDPNRLAGVRLGHWAIDAGMAYTYMPCLRLRVLPHRRHDLQLRQSDDALSERDSPSARTSLASSSPWR